jgi:glyoxylase-like metal-dependent hydrolase (beta-lactamase superfamily II)
MALEEVRPGLHRWKAVHPDWTSKEGGPDGWDPEVDSYLYESRGALVLFDPLVGDGETWAALDERVAEHGPPHVLITLMWHVRSAPEILARYPGTRVWAHDREPWIDETRKRVRVTDAFEPGSPLPAGIEVREPREVVYWIPEHRALLAGDVLLTDRAGGIRLTPWIAAPTTVEQLRERVRPLLDLPVELVLLTHGGPVENGRDALERALHAPSAA